MKTDDKSPRAPTDETPGRPAETGEERRLDGLGVSPGIAIGPAYLVEPGMLQVPEYGIEADAVAAEIARVEAAVETSRRQIRKLQAKAGMLEGAAGEDLGYLLEANLQILSGSRLIRGIEQHIAERKINAEAAVQAAIRKVAAEFARIEDPYIASRMQDIRDVGARLIRNLSQAPYQGFGKLPPGAIVIAEELTPADTAAMDPRRVGGFATALGGAEGHTAIMARSLGLPAVLGVPEILASVRPGDTVVVDGVNGRLVVNPTGETERRYRARAEELRKEERVLARLKNLKAESQDGVSVSLQVNMELPSELESALRVGAEGVGLLRSEFLYMNREDLPDEDEQYRALRLIVEGLAGRPVTVRTLDVGGDKLAYSLGEHLGDAANPALGLRAIRLSLKVRPLLETQLAAMLRAGAHGPLRILLPMVTGAAEVRQVREAMDKVARRLRRRRIGIADPLPPLGVMIETPAAALAADSLAFAADFFSIGTNDLTMYTLAIDRGNEQVAHLYDPLHPAVLRLLQFSTEAALRARIPVNLCGEMAGDPRYTALLLGLGLRDLSMSALNLPRVKRRIRKLMVAEAVRRSASVMEQADPGRIAAMLDDFNALV